MFSLTMVLLPSISDFYFLDAKIHMSILIKRQFSVASLSSYEGVVIISLVVLKLQDIIFRFKERKGSTASLQWSEFPTKVAVQLNDTHPTLAIPELMRLLLDEEGLGWDEAWAVTTRCIIFHVFGHTSLKLLPHVLLSSIGQLSAVFAQGVQSTNS